MGKQGTLTKAEMQVMNILWSLPSMKGTISDVLEGYGEKKPAYTTVATFMKILLNKGYVGFVLYNIYFCVCNIDLEKAFSGQRLVTCDKAPCLGFS